MSEKRSIRSDLLFVIRKNFSSSSDIDVLVTLHEKAKTTLFDIVRMKNELTEIFARKVDIISRRGIENSRNHLRRDAILGSAESVYAA